GGGCSRAGQDLRIKLRARLGNHCRSTDRQRESATRPKASGGGSMRVHMEGSSLKDRVMVELTKAEALVLSDWLSRFNKEVDEQALHPAEKRVLWDLECSLEQAL